jgi:enterochelin esterase-like enzyme
MSAGKKLMTAISCLMLMAATAQEMVPETGTIKHFANFESKLVEPRNIDVWLPEGYSTKEKYTVLYMHDGQMLFDASKTWNKQEWQVDEVAGELMKQNATRKFIVVGISSIAKIRMSDYFPQKPFESLPKKTQDSIYALKAGESKLFGAKVNSDNYLKFIVTELKPFIDKNFSVKTGQTDTFIGGSSMGGLISMYAVCEYPEVFGGAMCMSTHWPGLMENEGVNPVPKALLDYMTANIPDPKVHKFYFDYGDQTLDAQYKPYQLKADKIMEAIGYTDKNWLTREFKGLDHSETSWAVRLDTPLYFLLGI